MNKRIAIIDGHPDPDRARFIHALADSYAESAMAAGHEVRRVEVALLDFPVLRARADWEHQLPPAALADAAEAIAWADHLVLLYPLWLAGLMDIATEEVVNFVINNLRYVAETAGINQASVLADILVAKDYEATNQRIWKGFNDSVPILADEVAQEDARVDIEQETVSSSPEY